MIEDLEKGDVAETAKTFFLESTHMPPCSASTLKLQQVYMYMYIHNMMGSLICMIVYVCLCKFHDNDRPAQFQKIYITHVHVYAVALIMNMKNTPRVKYQTSSGI